MRDSDLPLSRTFISRFLDFDKYYCLAPFILRFEIRGFYVFWRKKVVLQVRYVADTAVHAGQAKRSTAISHLSKSPICGFHLVEVPLYIKLIKVGFVKPRG